MVKMLFLVIASVVHGCFDLSKTTLQTYTIHKYYIKMSLFIVCFVWGVNEGVKGVEKWLENDLWKQSSKIVIVNFHQKSPQPPAFCYVLTYEDFRTSAVSMHATQVQEAITMDTSHTLAPSCLSTKAIACLMQVRKLLSWCKYIMYSRYYLTRSFYHSKEIQILV